MMMPSGLFSSILSTPLRFAICVFLLTLVSVQETEQDILAAKKRKERAEETLSTEKTYLNPEKRERRGEGGGKRK